MNAQTPPPTPLEIALNHYQTALSPLDSSDKLLNKEKILEILSARDALQKRLETESEIPIDIWSKLVEQDDRLKQNAYRITEVLDLAEYRESLSIAESAWWWHLDSRESQHPFNRFDWLFKTFKLLLLGVNFTLIATIATRFLGGGSGWVEIGAVIFSTFISLLQTQNALTRAREKGFTRLMKRLKIREYWYEEIQFCITAIVFLILLIILLNFPIFSEIYKQQGKALQSPSENSQEWPQLASAQEKYLKAIELDPDNLDAHYKLGTLYEELQDLESAKKQYIIAAKGGFLDAYNNLSYLYIRENKDAEAADLLEKAKVLLAEKDQKLEQLTEDEKLNLQVQKYSIFKNLGWARFKQDRNDEAMINLSIAKSIAKNKDYQPYIRNPGAIFCLYAKFLQKQDKDKQNVSVEAKENWRKCFELSQGKEITLEEDRWLYEARQQLNLK
jgi:tetratricopeptide (TPR) repeat protein